MKFAEYLKQVAQYKDKNPQLRIGQSYYNVLAEVNSKLANQIRTIGGVDPFFRNDNIPEFLTYVCIRWDEDWKE